jgi:hypothetical protein
MRIEFENQRVETLEYFEKLKNRKSKGGFQESLKQRGLLEGKIKMNKNIIHKILNIEKRIKVM